MAKTAKDRHYEKDGGKRELKKNAAKNAKKGKHRSRCPLAESCPLPDRGPAHPPVLKKARLRFKKPLQPRLPGPANPFA